MIGSACAGRVEPGRRVELQPARNERRNAPTDDRKAECPRVCGVSSVGSRLLGGALWGTVATLVMSVFMLAAREAGLLTEQAPEEITERSIERTTRRDAGGLSLDLLTSVVHLAFGAASGALYAALLARRRGASVRESVKGTLFGTAVWLTSYWGVLPKLELMPPPPRDERRRPLVMLVAHLIYGGVLGALASWRLAPENVRARADGGQPAPSGSQVVPAHVR